MKNSLFTLFVLFQLGLMAQPVFNFNNLIGDSDLLTYKKAVLNGAIGPMTGQQQWNFSGLDSDSGIYIQLRDLSQIPILNAPAGANKLLVKLFESGASPEDQFNFYKADASGLEQLTIRADGTNYAAFSTPYKELYFPVEYNADQIQSSTSVTFTEPLPENNNDSLKTIRDITSYYSVPAYGTLTLPNNLTHEVLVIQRLETVTDAFGIYINGQWTNYAPGTYFNEYYDFLSPSEGYYIARAKLIEGEKGSAYEIYHLVSKVIIGIDEVDNKKVSIYPNPANDCIHLQSDVPINNVELFDLHGRKVKGWMPSQENIIQVSDLNAGFYFLKYTIGVQSFTHKIIIQH